MSALAKRSAIVRPWPRLLTVEAAADYLGVSRATIKEWLADGRIQPHQLPGIRGRQSLEKTVFDRAKLDQFVGLKPE